MSVATDSLQMFANDCKWPLAAPVYGLPTGDGNSSSFFLGRLSTLSTYLTRLTSTLVVCSGLTDHTETHVAPSIGGGCTESGCELART